MRRNIKDLGDQELTEWLALRREPAYRAAQIKKWLYQSRAGSFAEMTNLGAGLRAALEEDFTIGCLRTVRANRSQDGTVKFLFQLVDGLRIESVLIPEARRLTLCVSTQVGCGLGCAFCATARMGLIRNLTASEIVDQTLAARQALTQDQRITHIVLMGMGEPLANYAQTVRAVEIIRDAAAGIGISPRRITLSTVGLVPQIKRLLQETDVNLAVSLHAVSNDVRSQLMPINRKYPLDALLDCCRSLPIPRRRRITFEYVLLHGTNDSPADARRLSELLRGIRCKINLIPFNPHPGAPFTRPGAEDVARFQSVLCGLGHQVNVRLPRGDDIQAACGQLQADLAGAGI